MNFGGKQYGSQQGVSLKLSKQDFPGGPVVKNPPSNAGDVGSILGQGTKIPHALEQLRPDAAPPPQKNH